MRHAGKYLVADLGGRAGPDRTHVKNLGARYEIGKQAAELMLRRLDGDQSRIAPVDVGFRIIERRST